MSDLALFRDGREDAPFAAIVAGGNLDPNDASFCGILARAGLIIAADSGAFPLERLSIVPHVFCGDFDSFPKEEARKLERRGTFLIPLKIEKDQTDTEVALEVALERGFRRVFILGALGGSRPEHSLANISLMESYAKKGMDVIIHSPKTIIGGILGQKDLASGILSSLSLRGAKGDWVSLFPITCQVVGVFAQGLKFPLENGVLKRGCTLGVSNEMREEKATVSVGQGYLILVLTKRA